MRGLVVFALIFTFLSEASVALAAGPLEESSRRAAQQLAQAQGQPSNKKAFLWTGGALLGAGVALITLFGTGDPSCASRVCRDPQGDLGKVFLGLGIAGVGAAERPHDGLHPFVAWPMFSHDRHPRHWLEIERVSQKRRRRQHQRAADRPAAAALADRNSDDGDLTDFGHTLGSSRRPGRTW